MKVSIRKTAFNDEVMAVMSIAEAKMVKKVLNDMGMKDELPNNLNKIRKKGPTRKLLEGIISVLKEMETCPYCGQEKGK